MTAVVRKNQQQRQQPRDPANYCFWQTMVLWNAHASESNVDVSSFKIFDAIGRLEHDVSKKVPNPNVRRETLPSSHSRRSLRLTIDCATRFAMRPFQAASITGSSQTIRITTCASTPSEPAGAFALPTPADVLWINLIGRPIVRHFCAALVDTKSQSYTAKPAKG